MQPGAEAEAGTVAGPVQAARALLEGLDSLPPSEALGRLEQVHAQLDTALRPAGPASMMRPPPSEGSPQQ